jgi:hypothetical protein
MVADEVVGSYHISSGISSQHRRRALTGVVQDPHTALEQVGDVQPSLTDLVERRVEVGPDQIVA